MKANNKQAAANKAAVYKKSIFMLGNIIMTVVRYNDLYRYMAQRPDGSSEASFKRY